MKINIGQVQLDNLTKNKVSAEELVTFLEDVSQLVPKGSKFHSIFQQLRTKYILLNEETFVTDKNDSLKYYQELRFESMRMINILFKEHLLEGQIKFLDVIKENFELTDKTIQSKLGKSLSRLFSEPPNKT